VIAAQAGLTAGQTDATVAALERAGYLTTVGMLVQLTPTGARWYAA